MGELMTAVEFTAKARRIATEYKTSYMLGPWGWPANDKMIARACSGSHGAENRAWLPYANAIKNEGFLFDCVGLIKGILWGWSGDLSRVYGGAGYEANGLPDIDAGGMIRRCAGVSDDFFSIVPGEVVYMPGHIGIYVGGGVVAESTPRWNWGVQLSTCSNVSRSKVPGTVGTRTWTKHGKLPWVDYEARENREEDEEMDVEKFRALWLEMRKGLQDDYASCWSEEARRWAVENGIVQGNGNSYMWEDVLTREQMATMLYRFAKLVEAA